MNGISKGLLAAVVFTLAACGQDEGGGARPLKSGKVIEGAQACGVELPPCPSPLSCVVVEVQGEPARAVCVDPAVICKAMECPGGKCAVQESYPSRVVCQG